MPSAPSPGVVRAALVELFERWPDQHLLGLRCAGWSGPSAVPVGDRTCTLRWCPSSLAVRAAVQAVASHAEGRTEAKPRTPVVLITDRSDDEIGLDVLTHFPRNRFVDIDLWRLLPSAFSVKHLDSRLLDQQWLAEALLSAQPAAGYKPAAGSNVLDFDTAWSAFFEHVLGWSDDESDLEALTAWALEPDAARAFAALDATRQAPVIERTRQRLGTGGEAVLRLLGHGRQADIVAHGLVCRVLFSQPCVDTPAGLKAAGRFEASIGVPFSPRDALAWAASTERFVATVDGAPRRGHIRQAEKLLGQMAIEPFASASAVLPSGLAARVNEVAVALSALLRSGSPDDDATTERCLAMVKEHHAADEGTVLTLTMALRLTRWLATGDGLAVRSLPEAAVHYAHELSFVDLARHVLFMRGTADAGETGSRLDLLMRDLLARAQLRREHFNERFGTLAAGWFEADGDDDHLLPVDTIIDRVVAPLAAAHPVLLLVLDGLSFAVFQELIADLLDRGLEPMVPDALADTTRGSGLIGLAALPSVTHASRHALLTGRLEHGSQAAERSGFANHPAWRAQRRKPPLLFHKGDLRAPEGGLAEPVRAALADRQQRVVATVINAIDDHLSRGDQVLAPWTVTVFRHLDALLQAARVSNRVVVLTADHGHLPEWNLAYRRTAGDSARHRPAGSTPNTGEIKIEGPRVLTDSNAIVVPWSESVRYGRRQAGYHGGASPQELLVPVAVLASDPDLAGWRHLPGSLPPWWEGPGCDIETVKAPVTQTPATPAPPARLEEAKPEQANLFEAPASPAQPADNPSLLDRLFASELYQQQVTRVGGAAFADPARIRPILTLLTRHGGQSSIEATMRALNLGMPRLRSIVTQVQRLLNVDGYPILDLDAGAQTLRFDTDLLCAQFSLGTTRPEQQQPNGRRS